MFDALFGDPATVVLGEEKKKRVQLERSKIDDDKMLFSVCVLVGGAPIETHHVSKAARQGRQSKASS